MHEDNSINSVSINGTTHDRGNLSKNPLKAEELPEELQEYLFHSNRRGKTELQMLEGKHILSMIVYIHYMSPIIKTHIYTNIAKCSTINDKLEDLNSLGLIKMQSMAVTNTCAVTITYKGRLVARAIIFILKVLRMKDC